MVAQLAAPISIATLRAACSRCNLRELCLPEGMNEQEIDQLDKAFGTRRRIKRQQFLYRAGDLFESIFAIRSGSFKTDIVLEDGRAQVTGFQMIGEILGLDGISNDIHACNAVALEDSEICVIPYDRLEALSRQMETLHRQIHKLMSSEIVRDHGVMMLLGSMRAEERLAVFLLNLSQRLNARGFSSAEFVLRMTREEIGSYLGLKLETVSRTLSRFADDGIIEVQQKRIRIISIDKLRAIVRHHTSQRPGSTGADKSGRQHCTTR